jgi:hypothetical protein
MLEMQYARTIHISRGTGGNSQICKANWRKPLWKGVPGKAANWTGSGSESLGRSITSSSNRVSYFQMGKELYA